MTRSLPPGLIDRRDTLAALVAAQLKSRLNVLIAASVEAGEDSLRRQWDQMLDAIPEDARDAFAAGVWQSLMIAQEVRDKGGTPQEIVDRIMAQAVFEGGEKHETS
jgi:hypothetical protein